MLPLDRISTHSKIGILEGWEMLRQGEKKGLAIIYDAYAGDMFRVGMAIKPNSSYVQDCIHEVFENLWKYHSGLKVTDNVKLYLLRSISNKIHRDLAGNVGRIHGSHVNDFEEQISVDSYEFELVREQGNQDIRRRLMEAYEKLPLRQKEVIHLLFFESLTYEETSSVMNLHLKSVYNLACKAISNLRKSMAVITFFCIL
ncbi:MAG: sigma-70 family RNA polymerase sigma factor [Lunatimonas sp.]|uniref:RNA polymerase sigma factor n=1 Tax=Lunatimonas sp. TaxID=2060141 RepID=UPI00263A89AB|nr:sigma-70 family RNA polymerase sigma factor [Lunatimonas sp.]MCC5936056.1 sigma-70 family RNA polymerase sigma factor [Lunatimonas sp.]